MAEEVHLLLETAINNGKGRTDVMRKVLNGLNQLKTEKIVALNNNLHKMLADEATGEIYFVETYNPNGFLHKILDDILLEDGNKRIDELHYLMSLLALLPDDHLDVVLDEVWVMTHPQKPLATMHGFQSPTREASHAPVPKQTYQQYLAKRIPELRAEGLDRREAFDTAVYEWKEMKNEGSG